MDRPVIRTTLPTLLRVGAWGCIGLLAVLSLIPGKLFLRTDLAKLGYGTQIEHFIAYFGAATIVGLAYRTRLSRLTVALILIAYAALLEIAQFYSPDRTASVLDFSAGAAGVVTGALLIPMASRFVASMLSGNLQRATAARERPPGT
jgi:hypothetical protein